MSSSNHGAGPRPEVRYQYPACARALVWRRATGSYVLTAIVKVTFDLVSGGYATLAKQQRALSDDLVGDPTEARLAGAGDLVPYKPWCDVCVIGVAYPGGSDSAAGVEVAVSVDELRRRLRVPSRQLVEELAPTSANDRSQGSPARKATLAWARAMATSHPPAPAEADFAFFNAAPPEMQLRSLGEEPFISLEGLTPRRAKFATRLPRLAVSATVLGKAGTRELELRCDTLWIDAGARVATLTWRGVHDLPGGLDRAEVVTFDVQERSAISPAADAATTRVLPRTGRSASEPPEARRPPRHDEADTTKTYHGPEPGLGPEPLPFVKPDASLPDGSRAASAGPSPLTFLHDASFVDDGATIDAIDPLAQDSADALPFAAPRAEAAPDAGSTIMPLGAYAELAARLDLQPEQRQELLEHAGVNEERWRQTIEHWADAIEEQGRRGRTDALVAYDEAYLGALEGARGPITLRELAELSVAAERDAVAEAASTLGIPEGATLPVERTYTRRLMADPSRRKQLRHELRRARESQPEPAGR